MQDPIADRPSTASEPQHDYTYPSARRIFWWRTVAVVGVVVTVAAALVRLVVSTPPGLTVVALWSVIPLSVLFGAVAWMVAPRPYVTRGLRADRRGTLAERNATIRAVRRREPMGPDRVRLARAVIPQLRSGSRYPSLLGLVWTVHVSMSTIQAWTSIVWWLGMGTVILGLIVHFELLERAFRRWEQSTPTTDR